MTNTTFKAMNSTIQLVDIYDEDVQSEIKQMILDFEKLASRFISNNHLALINKGPLNSPILLHDTIADLLDKALILARKSDYYVHPFLGDIMKEIGYTYSFQEENETVFEERKNVQKFVEEPIEMLSKNILIKKQNFTFDLVGLEKVILLIKRKNDYLINIYSMR